MQNVRLSLMGERCWVLETGFAGGYERLEVLYSCLCHVLTRAWSRMTSTIWFEANARARMSKKRRVIPAALHSELTEYSSLIRALQTRKILDLTAHLTSSQPTTSSRGSVDEAGYEDDDEADESQIASSSQGPSAAGGSSPSRSSSKSKSQSKKKASSKGKARDDWTRWPMLAGDVHVPEWGLEDEVAHIALHHLASRRRKSRPPAPPAPASARKDSVDPEDAMDSADEEDEDEVNRLTPLALRALTTSASIYVSQVLALLAAHVPLAEKSMQNRVRPMDWESVLEIVAASGLARPTFVSLSE